MMCKGEGGRGSGRGGISQLKEGRTQGPTGRSAVGSGDLHLGWFPFAALPPLQGGIVC